jgi:uncharacterized protein YdaL
MIAGLRTTLSLLTVLLVLCHVQGRGDEERLKKVLIVVEGPTSLKSRPMGDGRQLAALLGHFQVSTTVVGANDYQPRSIEANDITFYVGFSASNNVPAKFLDDMIRTEKSVVWLNTGFREACQRPDFRRHWGFVVNRFDSTSQFVSVRHNQMLFAKGEPNLNIVEITDRRNVTVVATAQSVGGKRDVPYIVHAGNLIYVADSPFASAGSTDRYLLFADLLHDILGEQHEEAGHSALIRIEDVNPMENPDRLREIADMLSGRGIPFLVGVSPFYVNPGEGIRVSLSDKPDLVDALKYMVQNGGTIVMHGVTHQYRGITGSDYEFWDESSNGPIKDETVEGISRKMDSGIQEFMRNGLYPLIWETPHYTASTKFYQTIVKYFSSAMEQRLSIEDFDFSQFFPYIIYHDLYGQRVYPENLGYVPLDDDIEKGRASVKAIVDGARAHLAVRDGFAACFFHAFVDIRLLEELVDQVQALGYTYIDLREQTHWVKTKDRVILCGSQKYEVTLQDQYLLETTFERNGEIASSTVSPQREKGIVRRYVELAPGQFYKAEPVEFRDRKENLVDRFLRGATQVFHKVFTGEEHWREARPAIVWNHYARGASFNDQTSFISTFRSIGIPVDTLFIGERWDLTQYNLLIVPFGAVDSLLAANFDDMTRFVAEGGDLITDGGPDLVENFGIKIRQTQLRIMKTRERLYPEERVRWRYADLAHKFDADNVDEIFCVDEATEAPLVIGKGWGKGKVLFFATRFDPYSTLGISCYPYLLEYVRLYFQLGPIVRRDNLEVYFDPGFRRTLSTEQLVKQWVKQGVRVVHAAGWHQYPKYTYDYERLLRLAHANGILVYAWIEPPQVSQKFWQQHPEWREKNYRGEDVRPSWRYPVAMTDDRCLSAMAGEYRALLEQFPWDGVNIAEVYYEAARGVLDPQYYTPMNPAARAEIFRKYGFDVTKIFDPQSPSFWKTHPEIVSTLTEYRVQSLRHVYETLLPVLQAAGKGREGFEIIVTAMDSFGSPELREYIGVDMRQILALQKRFGFSLQVEDPEHLWSTDPHRYVTMGDRYAALLNGRDKLLLDLNILQFRKPDKVTPFPTLIQTGTECFQLVREASIGAPRQTIYSESSVNPQDMMLLPYALASGVSYSYDGNGYHVSSPTSFVMKLPADAHELHVDDIAVTPARENMYMIPAGEHRITLPGNPARTFSAHELETRILSITGNLLTVSYGMRSVQFSYASPTRTLVSLNRVPTLVQVDGEGIPFEPMKGNDCFSIYLPPGRHDVVVVAGDVFAYGISFTSFWYTTAVAVFGSIAVFSLLVMYVLLKFVRGRYAQPVEVP